MSVAYRPFMTVSKVARDVASSVPSLCLVSSTTVCLTPEAILLVPQTKTYMIGKNELAAYFVDGGLRCITHLGAGFEKLQDFSLVMAQATTLPWAPSAWIHNPSGS